MKRLLYITAAVILFAVVPAVAAESAEPNAPVTLDEYVRSALAGNAGLKSRFSEYKAAIAQVPQARTLDDPTFTYGYWIEQDRKSVV